MRYFVLTFIPKFGFPTAKDVIEVIEAVGTTIGVTLSSGAEEEKRKQTSLISPFET